MNAINTLNWKPCQNFTEITPQFQQGSFILKFFFNIVSHATRFTPGNWLGLLLNIHGFLAFFLLKTVVH